MRHTLYTGLARVSKWSRLKLSVMNLKRLAKRKANGNPVPFSLVRIFLCFTACLDFPRQAAFRQVGNRRRDRRFPNF